MTLRLGAACPDLDVVPLLMYLAITCDLCGAVVHTCREYIYGRRWISALGWVERDSGEFHCPGCRGSRQKELFT